MLPSTCTGCCSPEATWGTVKTPKPTGKERGYFKGSWGSFKGFFKGFYRDFRVQGLGFRFYLEVHWLS